MRTNQEHCCEKLWATRASLLEKGAGKPLFKM
jgi:hypothetical protein